MGDVRVTAREAAGLLLLAWALAVAGLVWLLGPYGLLGGAAALACLALFGFDVKGSSGEAVATSHRS